MIWILPRRKAMSGEHHESGEADWRDDPGNGSRALDELSREEILRALTGLKERLRADEDDAYSLLARGMLHSKLGDDRRAMQDFSRVIELEPDNAEALENRAGARDDLGEHRLAREDYDALIRLEPDNAVALYSRGACLAKLGDLAEAVADFDRAITLEPDDVIPYYNRGCTYAEMGDPRRALEDFTKPSPSTLETPPSTTTGASPTGNWASSTRPSATWTPRCGWSR